MNKQKRRELVLKELEAVGVDRIVSTRALAESLGVSEMTIRRDLFELSQEGLIHRMHGGATLPRHSALHATPRGQIGILLTSRRDKFMDPFFNEVLQGADRKLQEMGYRVAFVFTHADVHTRAQARNLLANYHADAILLIGTHYSECVEYLKAHVKILIATNGSLGPEYDSVNMNGRPGIRALVHHLAKLGRRRLAFITGFYDSRQRGFIEGIKETGLLESEELIVTRDQTGYEAWTPQMGQNGVAMLMKRKNPPDAIMCASDRMAIGAMQWLHQNGYRIPDDVAVTGFDNIHESEFTVPPLTTVHVYKELIGALAAERAIRRIENPDEIPLDIRTPTYPVIRQSCGAAAGPKPDTPEHGGA